MPIYLKPEAFEDKAIPPIKNKEHIIKTTYSELKSLVDNSQLIPGIQYRITDYITTTTQENTRSAGHQFDIIVTANNNNTLNEEARAIQHEGDTYFNECNLNAWKIWYSINNDTTRFAWADTKNGKGVIYRMVDEFNNDVPYDFKNIIYISKISITFTYDGSRYTVVRNNSLDKSINGTQYYCYSLDYEVSFFDGKNCWIKEETPKINSVLYKSDGSIVNLLGNILSVRVHEYESYTFDYNKEDITISTNNCHNNTIMYYYNNQKMYLNEIIFNNYCYNNSFGHDCHNNLFGSNCYNNSFGNNCYDNSFRNYLNNNSFGNNCYNNSFRNYFRNNSFGNYFRNNSFGGDCYNNSFGNDCYNIKFAENKDASNMYNYYTNNHFGDGCQYIVFTGKERASSSSKVQNYNFAQGLQGKSNEYLIIDGVRNRAYETKVAKNSNGELKIYCEADLIP